MPRLRFECPHCHESLPLRFLQSAVGRLNNSLRKNRGRLKRIRPCSHCGERKWGCVDLRVHMPRCSKNPKNIHADVVRLEPALPEN